ncbi:hypothetical protein BFP72_15440 [Reichenbachiella sp. 5M10]|nr:hypothetical protein BFP72_15440 [Reichenbachiella sp. 5M10]
MKIPTDLDMLNSIYRLHLVNYISYETSKTHKHKLYVPIDIDKISADLGCDNYMIFDRLYNHLNHKYSIIKSDGSKAELFVRRLGSEKNPDINCIQFPLMTSIIADLTEQKEKFNKTYLIAYLSLIISILAFLLSFWEQ